MIHATAQRVALGSGASVLGGLSIAWAGWAEHLGVLGGVLGTGLEVQTAAGVGMLTTALGIRWMVARWEKARRRWWRDWDRVGQGLERDIRVRDVFLWLRDAPLTSKRAQDTLERTVAQQVVLVPSRASEDLILMAARRKEEIGMLKDELYVLENELRRT